jgi:hypothetical protein
MSVPANSSHHYSGSYILMIATTAFFTALIALLGAAMMAVSSSPRVQGASFLWLPAAFQLVAGVWLGPIRGLIAGGIGAQVAGVIAYSGWAPADWIMNFVAGGFANSWLAALMFRWFRIDPSFGSNPESPWRSAGILLFLLILVLLLAVGQLFVGQEFVMRRGFGYLLPLIVLLIAPFFLTSLKLSTGDFFLALPVAIITCLISAAIGTLGAVIGGKTWEVATATGIDWFSGDFLSFILGIYVLAQFTERARRAGLTPGFIR